MFRQNTLSYGNQIPIRCRLYLVKENPMEKMTPLEKMLVKKLRQSKRASWMVVTKYTLPLWQSASSIISAHPLLPNNVIILFIFIYFSFTLC